MREHLPSVEYGSNSDLHDINTGVTEHPPQCGDGVCISYGGNTLKTERLRLVARAADASCLQHDIGVSK